MHGAVLGSGEAEQNACIELSTIAALTVVLATCSQQ